jgi:hypothetical protein
MILQTTRFFFYNKHNALKIINEGKKSMIKLPISEKFLYQTKTKVQKRTANRKNEVNTTPKSIFVFQISVLQRIHPKEMSTAASNINI